MTTAAFNRINPRHSILALALFGAMALQNSILIWGSQHRTHHRFVDDVDKDRGLPPRSGID